MPTSVDYIKAIVDHLTDASITTENDGKKCARMQEGVNKVVDRPEIRLHCLSSKLVQAKRKICDVRSADSVTFYGCFMDGIPSVNAQTSVIWHMESNTYHK